MSRFKKELDEQYWAWVHYLNYTMAPWIFAIAAGCYLSDATKGFTFFCAAFVGLWGLTSPLYPKNLKRLKANREIGDFDIYYRGYNSKHFGFIAYFSRFHVFAVSTFFLVCVAMGFTKSSIGL